MHKRHWTVLTIKFTSAYLVSYRRDNTATSWASPTEQPQLPLSHVWMCLWTRAGHRAVRSLQPPAVLAHMVTVCVTVSVWTWRQMEFFLQRTPVSLSWDCLKQGMLRMPKDNVDKKPWSCELCRLQVSQHRCFADLLYDSQLDPDKHLSEVSRNWSPEACVPGAPGKLVSLQHSLYKTWHFNTYFAHPRSKHALNSPQ